MARVFWAILLRLMSASFETGSGHSWTPSAGWPGLMVSAVVDTGAAAAQQAQVPVHGVLVQGDQEIDPIAHVGDLFRAGTNGKKGMAAANDGLVGVVDVQVQPTTAEDFGENVTRGSNALTGRAPYTNSEGLPHRFFSRLRGSLPDKPRGPAGSYPVKHYQDGFYDAILKCKPAYTQLLWSGSPRGASGGLASRPNS